MSKLQKKQNKKNNFKKINKNIYNWMKILNIKELSLKIIVNKEIQNKGNKSNRQKKIINQKKN